LCPSHKFCGHIGAVIIYDPGPTGENVMAVTADYLGSRTRRRQTAALLRAQRHGNTVFD
jgi:hypothetical protein